MIGELLSIQGAIGAFLLSLVVFGVAPGFVLAGIVHLIPDPDRRRELQAELYEVPRWAHTTCAAGSGPSSANWWDGSPCAPPRHWDCACCPPSY